MSASEARGIRSTSAPSLAGAFSTEPLRSICEVRPPHRWERERDKAVIAALMAEWADMPEPKPDYPVWLHGASSALLKIREFSS